MVSVLLTTLSVRVNRNAKQKQKQNAKQKKKQEKKQTKNKKRKEGVRNFNHKTTLV